MYICSRCGHVGGSMVGASCHWEFVDGEEEEREAPRAVGMRTWRNASFSSSTGGHLHCGCPVPDASHSYGSWVLLPLPSASLLVLFWSGDGKQYSNVHILDVEPRWRVGGERKECVWVVGMKTIGKGWEFMRCLVWWITLSKIKRCIMDPFLKFGGLTRFHILVLNN